jgi:hypothetical protein
MKMNKHGDSDISLSADDDEYQRQENKITDLIEIYKESTHWYNRREKKSDWKIAQFRNYAIWNTFGRQLCFSC